MADLNWVDFVIIGIVVLSAIVSLIRGLIPEVLSLIAWVAAFALAMKFFPEIAPHFEAYLPSETFRNVAAFAAIFLAVLIAGAIINFIIGSLVKATGFKATDRILGVAFGIARGGLVVALLALAAGLTKLPQEPFWQNSQLVPHFERAALWLKEKMPEDVRDHFRFEKAEQVPASESGTEPTGLEPAGLEPSESDVQQPEILETEAELNAG